MQELDRIYFQPLFRKKCQLILKVKRAPFKKHKRKLKKNCSGTRLTQNSNTSVTSRFDNICHGSQSTQLSKVTLRYVNSQKNRNPSNISSNVTIVPKHPSETLGVSQEAKSTSKKRFKSGQESEKKTLIKVSRNLRLWLQKRQIHILRRKLVNGNKNLHSKSKIIAENFRIWK